MQKTASQIATSVLKKLAAKYDQYGQPIPEPSPFMPMALGAGVGGLAGHHIFPVPEALALRGQALKAPAAEKELLLAAARKANIPRLGMGVGAGLLSGYLLNDYINS
jgi:hypothetical protein